MGGRSSSNAPKPKLALRASGTADPECWLEGIAKLSRVALVLSSVVSEPLQLGISVGTIWRLCRR